MRRKNENLANKASMILLNGTLILMWILILISIWYRYFNLHVYAILFCP